jgi:hypothetical protein
MVKRSEYKADVVGLPSRPFTFTLDQVATLLSLTVETLSRNGYVHFEGRSRSVRTDRNMIARNIAPDDQTPEWRIAEAELVRWMKVLGFRFHETSWLRD